MFSALTQKFRDLTATLSGKKNITEENIAEAIRSIRMALLDADVNYGVASSFVKKVKEKALGEAVLRSVAPGDQFTKIVHDELIALMGADEAVLCLRKAPSIIMLCGLQGSGKTTQCAKLAKYLKKSGKRVLIAACDLQRPAAVHQLKTLGDAAGVSVFSIDAETHPKVVARGARELAVKEGYDVLIVDTAGRLQIDEELMKELQHLKEILDPDEILFVASASIGQDAVKIAAEFNAQIDMSGVILTMLDGGARAGAALSIKEVTGKPLKFEGIGEKIDDLQLFNPRSMADRILGMGDVINLVKKAEECFDKDEEAALEKKMRTASFTYEDYLKQMKMLRKMGPLKGLVKMLPGAANLPMSDDSEKQFFKMEAILFSMTKDERLEKVDLAPSRRKRIAKGSGTSIDDVNRMIKGFKQLKLFLKEMPSMKQKMMNGTRKKENQLWR